jgi:mannosylglycerate hydrolase
LHHALDVPATFDREEGPGEHIRLDITTHIALNTYAGVSITIGYENVLENGRLRAVFPFPETDTLQVDSHFRIAERVRPEKQTPEDRPDRYAAYPGELTYPTQHQGDFVLHQEDKTCTWLANRGLPEYELLSMEEGHAAVAITLHRAVDMLSVEGGQLRRCQAGPSVPVPGAHCKRPIEAHLSFGTGKITPAKAIQHARAFAHPPWVRELPYLPYLKSHGQDPRADRLIEITNPAVELSTWAPAPEAETQVLRVFNRTGSEQVTSIRFGVPVSFVCASSLEEQWEPGAERKVIGGHLEVALGPHEVQTLLLR